MSAQSEAAFPPRVTENRYRYATATAGILAEVECLLYDRAEREEALAQDPPTIECAAASIAFIDVALAEAREELARRERLQRWASAPAWPATWPDRRPDVETVRAHFDQEALAGLIERTTGARFWRAGKRLVCRCPLPGHHDNSPSFTVYEGYRGWYCFGCRRGGNVFTFVMQVLTGTGKFIDALDLLAEEMRRGRA